MIYIKTKLKKIPHSCNKCKYSNLVYDIWDHFDRVCTVNGNMVCPMKRTENHNMAYTRPNWCPLIKKEGSE